MAVTRVSEPLSPIFHRVMCRGPCDNCILSSTCYKRKPEPREPGSFIVGSNTCLSFALEGDTLFSKAVCYIKKKKSLEKLDQNKISPCLCLQDGQKCEKPMENCLPKTIQRLEHN